MSEIYTYSDGIIHGYLEELVAPNCPGIRGPVYAALRVIYSFMQGRPDEALPKKHAKVVLQVTTNGKVWSWALRPYLHPYMDSFQFLSPRRYIHRLEGTTPEKWEVRRLAGRKALAHPFRDAVEWALRDLAKRTKIAAASPDALQIDVAYDREAPQESGRLKGGPAGPVRYTGWPDSIGSYHLDDVHGIVTDACFAAINTWGWKPEHLEVMLHEGNRAFGLAYAPGTGAQRQKRCISLNKHLLKMYDRQSIWRVVIHELCHHYRDEQFSAHERDEATADALRQAIMVAQLSGIRIQTETFNTHDSIFIRELSRVDDKVAFDPYTGMLFTEYADESLVAEVKSAKEARLAKKLAKISWDPAAGKLVVQRTKTSGYSVTWEAKDGSWAAPMFKLDRPGDRLLGLLQKLYDGGNRDAAKLWTVPVALVNWPSHWTQTDNLYDFVKLTTRTFGYPDLLDKLT